MYLFADLFLMRQLANGVSSPIDLTADDELILLLAATGSMKS